MSRTSKVVGYVTHAFPNSFYLRTSDDELLFITNRESRSPITVNVDWTTGLDRIVKPEDSVRALPATLCIGPEVGIDLTDIVFYDGRSSHPAALSPAFLELDQSLRTVTFLLKIVDTSGSSLDRDGLAHHGVADFVSKGVLPLCSEHAERQFQEAALKIVGLGSGFTPSGDDVLGGFLAAYNSMAPALSRPRILLDFSSLEAKTTWISAKLLDYMQHLILDEGIRSAIDSASKGDGDAVISGLETLFPRGHSSGIDISVGAVLGLSLALDITFTRKGIRRMADELGSSRQILVERSRDVAFLK